MKRRQNVGVASANLYPQITLSGYAGGVGTKFTSGGGIWNVEASLAQPIYNGGALRAERRKAVANYNIASQKYSAGGISQLALLDAQRQFLRTLTARNLALASRYTDSATLFQALGGGWWNQKPG